MRVEKRFRGRLESFQEATCWHVKLMNTEVNDGDWEENGEEKGSREADDDKDLYESRTSPQTGFHRGRNHIIQDVHVFRKSMQNSFARISLEKRESRFDHVVYKQIETVIFIYK